MFGRASVSARRPTIGFAGEGMNAVEIEEAI
jgi:hypothetical protein